MKIEIQKKKTLPLSERITIPVDRPMKEKIDSLKEKNKIDFNEMIRRFLEKTIQHVESGAA